MNRSQRVAVIGTGYVGLTAAACLASIGHQVICADISINRVRQLSEGMIPFFEEGLPELIQEMTVNGRLGFTNSNIDAVSNADFVFLCLPTPEGADGNADLSSVKEVAFEIGPHLLSNAVVINKSTVPVGTAFLVRDLLGRSDVEVASNPEFLAEGSAVRDFLRPDRIVIGSETPEVGRRVAELYAKLRHNHIIITDILSAELIKYASNAYLATRLTFINSIAVLCEAAGADIRSVAAGMGADRRIGSSFLDAGPGWGGSCFPKDAQALIRIAENLGCDLSLVKTAVVLNDLHTERIVQKVADALGGDLVGKVVAVWGLTFKAGTDDLRSSPSLKMIRMLKKRGATVCAYDPAVTQSVEGLQTFSNKEDACKGADILLIATEWPEFAKPNFDLISSLISQRIIVDARNILNAEDALAAGYEYSGVGLGNLKPTATRRIP